VKDKKIVFDDIFRYQGHNINDFKQEENLKFIPIVDVTAARIWKDKRNNESSSALMDLYLNNINKISLANTGKFIRIGFMIERNIKSLSKSWPWKTMRVIGNPAPKDWRFDFFTNQIVESEQLTIYPYGWSDIGHIVGHEQAIRNMKKKF